MRIGRISYLNTEPFFHDWDSDQFPFLSGAPRPLAEAARRGEIAAGPLPIVECWELEKEFVPLGSWGIAVARESGSVFVLSKKPFSRLHGSTLGLTQESSTSVILCKILLEQKHGQDVRMKRGLAPLDDACLVIGDQALRYRDPIHREQWPYVTDLATEWWDWQQLPFVFARWIVRTDTPAGKRLELERALGHSLNSGLAHLPDIAADKAPSLNLPAGILKNYLKAFIYDLGPTEEEAIRVFRSLAEKSNLTAVVS